MLFEGDFGKKKARRARPCVPELEVRLSFRSTLATLTLGAGRRSRRQTIPLRLVRLRSPKPTKLISQPLEQRLLKGPTSAVLGPDYPFWVGDGADYCA